MTASAYPWTPSGLLTLGYQCTFLDPCFPCMSIGHQSSPPHPQPRPFSPHPNLRMVNVVQFSPLCPCLSDRPGLHQPLHESLPGVPEVQAPPQHRAPLQVRQAHWLRGPCLERRRLAGKCVAVHNVMNIIVIVAVSKSWFISVSVCKRVCVHDCVCAWKV